MLSACLEEGAYDKLFLCWERIDDSKKQMSMESELIRMNVLLTKQNAGNVWAQFSNLKRGGFAAGCVLPVKASYRERLVELVPLDERQRRFSRRAMAEPRQPRQERDQPLDLGACGLLGH